MKKRIVRVNEGYWRIRSEKREISAQEQKRLIDYFDEIRFPYKVVSGRLCIPESVPWNELSERLEHFYDRTAEVYPF